MAKSRMDIEEALRKLKDGKLKQYLEQNNWFPPHVLDTATKISFLHYATEQASFELVQACVNMHAADINVKNGNHQTPLMWLLDRLASCKAEDKNHQNYAKIALFLINHDMLDLHVVDDTNNNLLHFAASTSDHQFLHALIEKFKYKKANLSDSINAMNSVGRTPLHLAVRQDNLSQHNIEILLMAGAKPELAEGDKRSDKPIDKVERLAESPRKGIIRGLLSAIWPMQEMLKNNNEASLELLRHMKLPDLSDEVGRTPLYHAASYGQQGYVTLLGQRNCDVNKQDDEGWTPLHAAAIGGHEGVVQQLLSRGADVKLKNKQQRTALDEVKQLIDKQGSHPKLITVQNLLQGNQHSKYVFFKNYLFELLLVLAVLVILAAAAILLLPTFAPIAVTQLAVTIGLTKLQAFLSFTACVLTGALTIEGIKLLSGNCNARNSNTDKEVERHSNVNLPLLKNNEKDNDLDQQRACPCIPFFLFPSQRRASAHQAAPDKCDRQRLVP